MRDEGNVIGKAGDILELLDDIGDVSDELRAQILKQRDLDVLSRWLKLAARSRTVEEFEYAVAEMQNPPACH